MRAFASRFAITNQTHILDVGGGTQNWGYITAIPEVTICNIDVDDGLEDRFIYKRADGRRLPFETDRFDVAYSNSVIEHVGDWDQQRAFADEIRRVSRNYYVQTPNRWFLVEPHFIAPIIHLFPRRLYRRLLPFFSLWYWIARPSQAEVDAMFDEIRLLDRREMRQLFPDAVLLEEKFMFMTKSLIAVRIS